MFFVFSSHHVSLSAYSLIISHFCFALLLNALVHSGFFFLIHLASTLYYHVVDSLALAVAVASGRAIDRKREREPETANGRTNELTIKTNCFPRHVICRLV